MWMLPLVAVGAAASAFAFGQQGWRDDMDKAVQAPKYRNLVTGMVAKHNASANRVRDMFIDGETLLIDTDIEDDTDGAVNGGAYDFGAITFNAGAMNSGANGWQTALICYNEAATIRQGSPVEYEDQIATTVFARLGEPCHNPHLAAGEDDWAPFPDDLRLAVVTFGLPRALALPDRPTMAHGMASLALAEQTDYAVTAGIIQSYEYRPEYSGDVTIVRVANGRLGEVPGHVGEVGNLIAFTIISP